MENNLQVYAQSVEDADGYFSSILIPATLLQLNKNVGSVVEVVDVSQVTVMDVQEGEWLLFLHHQLIAKDALDLEDYLLITVQCVTVVVGHLESLDWKLAKI